jgi:hypothetical protein
MLKSAKYPKHKNQRLLAAAQLSGSGAPKADKMSKAFRWTRSKTT